MSSTDPMAWLGTMGRGDFQHPRWQKYVETGSLLEEFYEQITGFRVPGGMPSLFGDFGMRTVSNAATAVWLCKNALPLFRQVAARLEDKRASGALDPVTLVQEIVGLLQVEARYLSNRVKYELLAELMASLAVGILPADTDWSGRLRELFNLQFESSSGSGWERPVMRWAIEIELDRPQAALDERIASFDRLFEAHRDKTGSWELNPWAYLLLRLEMYRPATPMAEKAVERKPDFSSFDTYGWALFYEKDYERAGQYLSRAIQGLGAGSSDWCEVQYHRAQLAFWSGRLSDARVLIAELQEKAPEDHWTARATELKGMVTKARMRKRKRGEKYEYDVAISFAGENRRCADELARALLKQGFLVFYDDFDRSIVWGQDLYTCLTSMYRDKAKFCVIFVSEHYARKRWTDLECRAAQARAAQENKPYIPPVRLDDTQIPGLPRDVSYMSWEKDGIPLIVRAVEEKLAEQTRR